MEESMGYDLFGVQPTSSTGEYFRRNLFFWPPLAGLCLDLAPKETRPCRYWFTNDGDGLNATQALALAARLEQLLADDGVTAYLTRLRQSSYTGAHRVDEEDVQEFVAFLKDCGGFTIV
jgi:hypothetical protein